MSGSFRAPPGFLDYGAVECSSSILLRFAPSQKTNHQVSLNVKGIAQHFGKLAGVIHFFLSIVFLSGARQPAATAESQCALARNNPAHYPLNVFTL